MIWTPKRLRWNKEAELFFNRVAEWAASPNKEYYTVLFNWRFHYYRKILAKREGRI